VVHARFLAQPVGRGEYGHAMGRCRPHFVEAVGVCETALLASGISGAG
jgi:hypothetical protein